MDFLHQYALKVDFDRGELLFLKSSHSFEGTRFPLLVDEFEMPRLMVKVPGEGEFPFLIDTGIGDGDSGVVAARTIATGLTQERYRLLNVSRVADASGESRARNIQINRLELGSFTVERPVFSSGGKANNLGLGFWSRFVVTFDFPGRAALSHSRQAVCAPRSVGSERPARLGQGWQRSSWIVSMTEAPRRGGHPGRRRAGEGWEQTDFCAESVPDP